MAVRGEVVSGVSRSWIVQRIEADFVRSRMQGVATRGLEGVTPLVRVRSLEASLNYYVHQLGFTLDWESPGLLSVSRGRCVIFLAHGHQGHSRGWVWVGVSDADRLLEEYGRTGAKVSWVPTIDPWAYEVQVEDPDGNVFRFRSDPKSDGPVGKWLDLRGDRFPGSAENQWTQVKLH